MAKAGAKERSIIDTNRPTLQLSEAKWWKIFTYSVLIFGALISLIPFAWMILKSLMNLGESMGSTLIPEVWHFENYTEAWEIANFSKYFFNSVVITLVTLAGEMLFSITAAYAFARMQFPGKSVIFAVLLSSMMIPGMVTMIPNLLTVTWL